MWRILAMLLTFGFLDWMVLSPLVRHVFGVSGAVY